MPLLMGKIRQTNPPKCKPCKLKCRFEKMIRTSTFFSTLSFLRLLAKNRTRQKFSAVFNLDKTALERIPHYRRTPCISIHSVLRRVLTLNISTIRETLIFRSGWVIRIMPYVHFFPPPSLLSYYFLKNWKCQVKRWENRLI